MEPRRRCLGSPNYLLQLSLVVARPCWPINFLPDRVVLLFAYAFSRNQSRMNGPSLRLTKKLIIENSIILTAATKILLISGHNQISNKPKKAIRFDQT